MLKAKLIGTSDPWNLMKGKMESDVLFFISVHRWVWI
jgi:hypothetical protein